MLLPGGVHIRQAHSRVGLRVPRRKDLRLDSRRILLVYDKSHSCGSTLAATKINCSFSICYVRSLFPLGSYGLALSPRANVALQPGTIVRSRRLEAPDSRRVV